METTVPVHGRGADGLGLFKHPAYCGDGWGHTGGTSGYLTAVLASRDGARIAIVAANRSTPLAAGGLSGTGDLIYCWH